MYVHYHVYVYMDCMCIITSCLQFATEAAITILRIDDMITLYKEEEPQYNGHGHC